MAKRLALRVIFIIVLCLFSVIPAGKVSGAQFICPPNYLRVALGLNLTSAQFSVTGGNYELVDYVTQQVIGSSASSGNWLVAPAGTSKMQVSNNGTPLPALTSDMLILRQKNTADQNIFRFKNKSYRGNLLIENISGRIQIINVIDIEQYLYGVVGAEMGAGAPLEAYKAQAVVSRSYALYYKEHPQLNYDLGISTQWQVYDGYDAETKGGALVKQGVDDTKGQVLYYDNGLVQAFFHSNSGGYTESCENVWYYNLPYLQPVSAPEDAVVTKMTQYGAWPAETYQWQKNYTRQELVDRLKRWNADHPDNAVNVGDIRQIVSSSYAINPQTREYLSTATLSKRVTQLDFVGTQGTKSFFRDTIRSVLNLKSTLFEIVMDSSVKVWNAFGTLDSYSDTRDFLAVNVDGLVSKLNGNNGNYYVIGADGVKSIPKSFSSVVINGKGYGHGLGMSQWGAWGLAVQGTNYRKILEHYYNQDKNDGRLQIKQYSAGQ